MRKSIITLAVTALMGFTAMAQLPGNHAMKNTQMNAPKLESQRVERTVATKDVLPEWHEIMQNVTGQDLNGNTISTEEILSSGKCMVIDYSATWCSWCYVMHQNGILDAIVSQLGEQVEVVWCEADPSTDANSLYGGTGSQGNWTVVYGTNNPVPYPIVDDPDFADLIGASNITGFPTVVFVSPSGYWCDVYGTDWGFGPYDANEAVSAVSELVSSYPQSGEAPRAAISGKTVALINTPIEFSANIVSVDEVTGISWTFPGANTPTATGANPAAVSWSTAGTYTVTLEVTNTTGTTTVDHEIRIRDGWEFDDEMDYTDGGEMESAIGLQSGDVFEWGVLYPAELMSGRNYVTKVSAYIGPDATGTYTVRIYQGGTDAPQTLVYECPFNVTETELWTDFTLPGGAQIDPTKSMWVTLSASGYAATYTTYNGDPNSSLLTMSGQWYTLSGATQGIYEGTWMIITTTSATAPAFDFVLSGPTSLANDDIADFSVMGPSDATYNWTFQGGTPATATGMTATASWANAGNYTVTVEGTRNGSSITKTLNVSVVNCNIDALPYTEGFENSIDCWTILDQDGDGISWMDYGFDGRSGSCISSASYINGVGALAPDNWLISPKFHVPAEGATIEWWSGAADANYANDYYSVLVSTTGKNPSDFTGVIYAGENESQQFTKHSHMVGYAGQDVYIAFRHHNCQDIYWLLIDDVTISAGNTASIDGISASDVKVYPNPSTGRFMVRAEQLQSVTVFDAMGREVMNTNSCTVDLGSYSNGVYMFQVVTANGIYNQKVVKK